MLLTSEETRRLLADPELIGGVTDERSRCRSTLTLSGCRTKVARCKCPSAAVAGRRRPIHQRVVVRVGPAASGLDNRRQVADGPIRQRHHFARVLGHKVLSLYFEKVRS